MKTKNMTPRIITHFLLFLFSLFVLVTESNAQAECKRKLDEYNRRNPFPTGQIDDYGACLDNLTTYFKGLKTSDQNLAKLIRDVEIELEKNQANAILLRQM